MRFTASKTISPLNNVHVYQAHYVESNGSRNLLQAPTVYDFHGEMKCRRSRMLGYKNTPIMAAVLFVVTR